MVLTDCGTKKCPKRDRWKEVLWKTRRSLSSNAARTGATRCAAALPQSVGDVARLPLTLKCCYVLLALRYRLEIQKIVFSAVLSDTCEARRALFSCGCRRVLARYMRRCVLNSLARLLWFDARGGTCRNFPVHWK